jgi:hypothetical protein
MPTNPRKPVKSRKSFAVVGMIAGLALIVLELIQPLGSTTTERVFWIAVGVLLAGVGVAQLRTPPSSSSSSSSSEKDPRLPLE